MPKPIPCTVCSHPTAHTPFFYEWKGRHFTIRRCTDCTHQFVYPPVTPDDQAEIYGDKYFSPEGDWVCGITGESYFDSEPLLRREAREVLSMIPASKGRLLDFGCAGGVFLDQARTAGFSVAGIELNPTMAKHASETYGVDVRSSPIEQLPIDAWADRFDVVTLLDCLEHIPEPRSALAKVSEWLRPGGYVLIRGPLSNSWLVEFKEALRRFLHIPKQLPGYPLDANMFNKRSIERLLTDTGFSQPVWINATRDFANLLAQRSGTPN
jgi:SAM-dependent methyltransferase